MCYLGTDSDSPGHDPPTSMRLMNVWGEIGSRDLAVLPRGELSMEDVYFPAHVNKALWQPSGRERHISMSCHKEANYPLRREVYG